LEHHRLLGWCKYLLELSIGPLFSLDKVENLQITMHGLMKLFEACLTDKLLINYEILKL
jgi:hypothetical protein